MNENDYLKQIAALTGLERYPLQGPWGRKSGSVIGARDGYVTVIGFLRSREAKIVILLRFKKLEQPELVKSAVSQSTAVSKKHGKLAEVGNNFLRWEWKYSFTKPRAEDVARLTDALRESIKPVAQGFDGRCEHCASASTPALTLMNGLPIFICRGCQEKVHHELDQAAINYDAIVPNYPNGLALGIGAAARRGRVGAGGLRHQPHFPIWLDSDRVLRGRRRVEGNGEGDTLRASDHSYFHCCERLIRRRNFLYTSRNEARERAVLQQTPGGSPVASLGN